MTECRPTRTRPRRHLHHRRRRSRRNHAGPAARPRRRRRHGDGETADFLRDFRGDTVHASTLRLLDELSLADDFARMPHREIDTLNMKIQGTEVSIDVSRILVPHKNIALVPQWDLLELLAAGRKGADVPAAAQHQSAGTDSQGRQGDRCQLPGRLLLPVRLRHPQGPRRGAACAGHRNSGPRW